MKKNEENNVQFKEKGLKARFRLFFQEGFLGNRINFWLALFGLILNIADWLVLLIFLRPATENIILHYNVYFGVDLTGKRVEAFVMPGIGFIIYFINYFLSSFFFRNDEKIAGYVLLAAGLLAQISLIIASLSVIIINY